MKIPPKALRTSLSATAKKANVWFKQSATTKKRDDWDPPTNKLEDSGIGAVYAFFKSGKCLYVGQTTTKLKTRALAQKSRHYDTDWWGHWNTIKFVNIANRTDQIVLEMLLVLALKPMHNKKPGHRKINQFLAH